MWRLYQHGNSHIGQAQTFKSPQVFVKLLCPTIHSLSFHTQCSITLSNQPSMSKNKDLKQSTKGPPVLLAWCLGFGESFFQCAQPVKFVSAK